MTQMQSYILKYDVQNSMQTAKFSSTYANKIMNMHRRVSRKIYVHWQIIDTCI